MLSKTCTAKMVHVPMDGAGRPEVGSETGGDESCDGDPDPDEGSGNSGLAKRRKGKSTRWNIPKHALQALEEVFKSDKFPTVETRKNLSADLRVTPRQVQVWFQNKRQRAVKPAARLEASMSEPNFLSTSVRREAARSESPGRPNGSELRAALPAVSGLARPAV